MAGHCGQGIKVRVAQFATLLFDITQDARRVIAISPVLGYPIEYHV